eukprot:1795447-Rhodomonas_salina.2
MICLVVDKFCPFVPLSLTLLPASPQTSMKLLLLALAAAIFVAHGENPMLPRLTSLSTHLTPERIEFEGIRSRGRIHSESRVSTSHGFSI